MSKKAKQEKGAQSRREFLKIGGAVAAGLQVGALAGAEVAAGKDPSTHTGWQHLGEHTQFVDRSKLLRKGPAYEIVGERLRPERFESAFGRQGLIMRDLKEYREMIEPFNAWSDSWSTRARITEPPEESDFKLDGRRRIGDPMPFKSPEYASKLIKKVAHHFGASMVGITTIEPD